MSRLSTSVGLVENVECRRHYAKSLISVSHVKVVNGASEWAISTASLTRPYAHAAKKKSVGRGRVADADMTNVNFFVYSSSFEYGELLCRLSR